MPATIGAQHARLTGVQKAPRHEVAGSLVPAGQRGLWGFDLGADLDHERDASLTPSCVNGRDVG